MKLATTQSTKPVTKTKKSKSPVPFNEMCHLMRVYGPLKCLRKRRDNHSFGINNNSSGSSMMMLEKSMKTNSIKRKFYRWFPDLNDRFVKTNAGFYMPKFGHENEIHYREEMRKKDGEILNEKRTTKRRGGRHQCTGILEVTKVVAKCESKRDVGKRTTCRDEFNLASAEPVKAKAVCIPVSTVTPPIVAPLKPSFLDQEATRVEWSNIKLDLDHDPMEFSSIVGNMEALDCSFSAKKGIFDDVEKSFYGSPGLLP